MMTEEVNKGQYRPKTLLGRSGTLAHRLCPSVLVDSDVVEMSNSVGRRGEEARRAQAAGGALTLGA